MDVGLEQLLNSFAEAHGQYTLARLELALHHPAKPAPPVVGGIAESYEGDLRARWPEIETQLEDALAFVDRLERGRRRRRAPDRALRTYARMLRELDRSVRAIRWALTVGETGYDI
ncbi:MAG TPA: hypothetical protein VGX91_15005 [Candidatus Cybelea sp.]|jgi:hypothetical protein|nr:hypothetical protein [Candidatus Cybelea sp.]